ncbi:MAG TPA: hypothetical protein VGD91_23875 [Trebonia sp.]
MTASTASVATAPVPNAAANGCRTTGGPVLPACCVELTERNATASTTSPDSRNAPA